MDIYVDNWVVLDSGTIVIDSTQKISFKIGGMTFIFDFLNEDKEGRDVRQEHIGNTMITHLINFNSSIGSGLKKPTEMATLGSGEKLYFSFAVHALGDTPKMFHYTWMKGLDKEQKDGKE